MNLFEFATDTARLYTSGHYITNGIVAFRLDPDAIQLEHGGFRTLLGPFLGQPDSLKPLNFIGVIPTLSGEGNLLAFGAPEIEAPYSAKFDQLYFLDEKLFDLLSGGDGWEDTDMHADFYFCMQPTGKEGRTIIVGVYNANRDTLLGLVCNTLIAQTDENKAAYKLHMAQILGEKEG